MRKRIFIAILLPEKIREELAGLQKKFRKHSVRLTKPENLHFTLSFIGWIEEEKIEKIKKIIKDIAQGCPSFTLRLIKISPGPNPKFPRMIWAIGEKEERLEKVWRRLREGFKESHIPVDERYPLKVHLTLARAKGKELFGQEIDERIDINLPVKEIAIMESYLKPEGAEYRILQAYPLRE